MPVVRLSKSREAHILLPCPGSPSSRSCGGARRSPAGWAAAGARRAPAPRGRLTVRERIDRLLDAGHLPRDRRDRGRAELRRDGELTDFLPANVVDRPGPDRRAPRRSSRATTSPSGAAPPTPRSGRRWSTRSGSRTSCGSRSCAWSTARAAAGSVKSLEQMGFTYVPVHPGLGRRGRQPLDGAGRRRGARAGGRARRGARRRLALLA